MNKLLTVFHRRVMWSSCLTFVWEGEDAGDVLHGLTGGGGEHQVCRVLASPVGADDDDEDEAEGGHRDGSTSHQLVLGERGEVEIPRLVPHLQQRLWTKKQSYISHSTYSLLYIGSPNWPDKKDMLVRVDVDVHMAAADQDWRWGNQQTGTNQFSPSLH